MTQEIASFPLKERVYCTLKNFERDNTAGPVPFDGTKGPYCIITGLADVVLLNNLLEQRSLSARYKVAIKVRCGVNEVPEGMYYTKVFEGIVYLVKRFG